MARALVVEDDRELCEYFSQLIEGMGHDVIPVDDYFALPKGVKINDFDFIILEAQTKAREGHFPILESGEGSFSAPSFIKYLVPLIQRQQFPPPIIVVTTFGFSAEAKLAIEHGMLDYIQIPTEIKQNGEITRYPNDIEGRLKNQIEFALNAVNQKYDLIKEINRKPIIGKSLQILSSLEQVALAAKNNEHVLITGETGTGKELLSRAIHENSDRAQGPFVALNCAAFTETLVESELFGIKAGVATDVKKDMIGKIKLADHGTLFLDEVGDLSLATQTKLLRVIETQNFFRVGGTKEDSSDFRLISATNRDLDRMVKSGQFRNDLKYRLETFTVNSHPLRERQDDIKILIEYYVQKVCMERSLDKKNLSPEFIEALIEYNWPGNIRELFNVVNSAVSLSHNESLLLVNYLPIRLRVKWTQRALEKELLNHIDVSDILQSLNISGHEISKEEIERAKELEPDKYSTAETHDSKFFAQSRDNFLKWKDYEAKISKDYLNKLMMATGYNTEEAAKIYGISKSHFYKILKKNNIATKPQAQFS